MPNDVQWSMCIKIVKKTKQKLEKDYEMTQQYRVVVRVMVVVVLLDEMMVMVVIVMIIYGGRIDGWWMVIHRKYLKFFTLSYLRHFSTK